jgi:hypothetical protein
MDERPDAIDCALCGSRLRRDDASEATNRVGELLTTVAWHRCAPRVNARVDAVEGPRPM